MTEHVCPECGARLEESIDWQVPLPQMSPRQLAIFARWADCMAAIFAQVGEEMDVARVTPAEEGSALDESLDRLARAWGGNL